VAWNEPGKPGDKDPWGQRRKPGAGGPDLDRIVRDIQQKLAGLFGGGSGGGSSGGGGMRTSGMGLGLIVAVACSLACHWFHVVNQGERGGPAFRQEGGDHRSRPALASAVPIEKVEKVNVEKVP
jgi:membrane protease subunit HflK